MSKNVPSLVGERFGRWVVLDKAEKDKNGEAQYLCRCDCGSERIIRRTSLTTGKQIKKMTNAQKIRAMSDEELSVFLWELDTEEIARATEHSLERRKITEWLKQPAE